MSTATLRCPFARHGGTDRVTGGSKEPSYDALRSAYSPSGALAILPEKAPGSYGVQTNTPTLSTVTIAASLWGGSGASSAPEQSCGDCEPSADGNHEDSRASGNEAVVQRLLVDLDIPEDGQPDCRQPA